MEYTIIICLGQSNMNGEAPIASFSATQVSEKTKVLSWYNGSLSYYKAGVNNRRRSISEQKGGLDIELATQLEANYSGGVILLKVAKGATGTYSGQPWNPSVTTWYNSQYLQFKLQISLFEKFFAKNLPDDTFSYKCILWNQGEQDGTLEANSLAYETNCGAVFVGLKTFLGLPTIPIYSWKLSNLSSTTYKANINTAKIALHTTHGNGGVLYETNSSDGYVFQDLYHYDESTYTLAGARLYDDLILNGHL